MQINLYTVGDSTKISTWSGVPYFLAKSLENKGIKLNRINLAPNKYIEFIYKKFRLPFYKYLHKDTQYNYFRSRLNRWLTNIKIQRAAQKYKNADLNFIISYSFNAPKSKAPTIMLSDWMYNMFIKDQMKRNPYNEEKRYIQYEQKSISTADMIFSLFPESAQRMALLLNREVKHVGTNVVNNNWNGIVNEQLIALKQKKITILFIGRPAYIEGAEKLLSAFKLLNYKKQFNAELHFIGISKFHFSQALPANVFCHGYLRKENLTQNEKYYDLLTRATLFINPSQEWGGYSSTIEAMYFYTPIIVAPYSEFKKEFGEDIQFGKYFKGTSEEELAKIIENEILLSTENYKNQCLASHNAVHQHTWENFIKLLLTDIKKQVLI